MHKRKGILAAILLLLLLGAGLYLRSGNSRSQAPGETGASAKRDAPVGHFALYPADLQALSRYLEIRWAKPAQETPGLPELLGVPTEGVYVAAREEGLRRGEQWGSGATVAAALETAIDRLRAEIQEPESIDTLEIFLALEAEAVDPVKQRRRLLSNIRRGIFGLRIGLEGNQELYSPTYVVATNRKNERLIELYGQKRSLTEDELEALPYHFLLGPQLLVTLGQEPVAQLMERGNRYIPFEEVNRAGVTAFAERMADWMWNSLHPDGRMTYLYWPSQGVEAPGRDNLIRQFMATIALGRVAAEKQDAGLWKKSATNIDYNLARYYQREGELGVVELRGKVKLGAVALAALAIVEHEERDRWAEQEAALRRTVQSLWHEDGSFTTFLRPEGRNDVQNFYPGEALLLWATLYRESKDEALLEQFMKSFRYYRSWHLDASVPRRRNPAFIPWHTQADYMVWKETGDEELKDFIFEMNDWLLDVQQWEDARYPDTRGRFYDPDRPFGPPHASSTGVYLEGLIDAYQLAREIGDAERARRYGLAIRRGLRSSMQLQFADDIDMFYVSKKERVRGGLRTTVYDNQIRCDNVQHTLMGTLKILASDVLANDAQDSAAATSESPE